MIKFLIKHFVAIMLFLAVLILNSFYPNTNIEVSGGLAWAVIVYGLYIASYWLIILVNGGEMTFGAEGLIPTVKRWMKKK